ncbi:transcriptional regulator [Streptococcus iniae]
MGKNISQPDINVLPELAIIFGVRIDDIFTYNRDKMYDKIDGMLENHTRLDSQDFCQFEAFLLHDINQTNNRYQANSTLTYLYYTYSEQVRSKAVIFGKKALELQPNSKVDITLINNASGGAIYDWDCKNHSELITYYQKTLKTAPENSKMYFYLLDNLIEDNRLDEAQKVLQESYDKNSHPLNHFYKILLDEKKLGFLQVKERYEDLAMCYQDDWRVLFSVANNYCQNGAYVEAIPIWEKACQVQEKPRYTDYYESIAQCYLLMNDKENAVKAYQEVLKILKEDWNCKFGFYVDRINQKIEALIS